MAGKCQETENDPFPSQIGGIVGRIFCYNDPDGSPQRGVVTGCDNYGFVSVGIAEADPGQLQPEDIKDGGYAGGIAGICLGGTIEDCANHMQVSGNEEIGGIAGYAGDEAFAADGPLCAVIRNCSNDVSGYTIRGITNAGGIAGCVASSGDLIEQCRNSGMIVADGEDAGGIAGIMGGGTIDKSFNEGSVTAASCAGGIIGSAEAEDGDICITSCYNRGTITGESATGGIAGSVSITETVPGPVKIANCYNSGWVSVSRDPADAGAADGAGGVLGSLIYEKDTDAVSVTNCYYLNGSVDGSGIYGTEDAESGVYGMDQADFADGHVTWLLQNGVDDDVLVWGQKLPQFYDTYDEFPVLAQVEEEKVVSVIWLADDEVVHEGFANPGEMLDITVNKDIVKEGYFLDGWYTDPEYTTEWDFAADTAGIEDLYLYARWIPEEELLYGDADKNGIVDSADALFILQYVVKLVQPDAPQFSYGAADVDGNLAITVEDAFLVLQKAVEIIDRFPIQEAAAAGLKQ